MGHTVNGCLIDLYEMYDFHDFSFCQKGCYIRGISQFDRSAKIVISRESGGRSRESALSQFEIFLTQRTTEDIRRTTEKTLRLSAFTLRLSVESRFRHRSETLVIRNVLTF
jgi:hypothetical protein